MAADNSSDLDMVRLFQSSTVDGEVVADIIHGILESAGIPSIVVRTPYHSLGFEVRVTRAHVEEAQRLIAEARAAGAEAAEAASKEEQ